MVPTLADLSPHHPVPHHHISPLLIAMAVLLAASFLLAVSYFIYSALPQRQQQHPDLFNRHRPSLYITTEGLHPLAVESIATCEYKDSESVVHGTVCAVCLAEFEGGESLRLLPTCCHAFHVLCIDTWLASHTTCPICRAPVLPAAIGLPGKGPHTIEIIHGLGSS